MHYHQGRIKTFGAAGAENDSTVHGYRDEGVPSHLVNLPRNLLVLRSWSAYFGALASRRFGAISV